MTGPETGVTDEWPRSDLVSCRIILIQSGCPVEFAGWLLHHPAAQGSLLSGLRESGLFTRILHTHTHITTNDQRQPQPVGLHPGLRCQNSVVSHKEWAGLAPQEGLARWANSRERGRKDRVLGQSCCKSWLVHLPRGPQYLLGSF